MYFYPGFNRLSQRGGQHFARLKPVSRANFESIAVVVSLILDMDMWWCMVIVIHENDHSSLFERWETGGIAIEVF